MSSFLAPTTPPTTTSSSISISSISSISSHSIDIVVNPRGVLPTRAELAVEGDERRRIKMDDDAVATNKATLTCGFMDLETYNEIERYQYSVEAVDREYVMCSIDDILRSWVADKLKSVNSAINRLKYKILIASSKMKLIESIVSPAPPPPAPAHSAHHMSPDSSSSLISTTDEDGYTEDKLKQELVKIGVTDRAIVEKCLNLAITAFNRTSVGHYKRKIVDLTSELASIENLPVHEMWTADIALSKEERSNRRFIVGSERYWEKGNLVQSAQEQSKEQEWVDELKNFLLRC